MDHSSFGAKLELVLKVLSMSRARLAADLAVDKSLVGRWVSGAVVPSAHNLARLTQYIAGKRPDFSMLDWDRDLEGLANSLGVAGTDPGPSAPAGLFGLPLPADVAAAARVRNSAYAGFWRHTRSAGVADRPDLFVRGYFLMRETPGGLMRLTGGLFDMRIDGWVLPVQNQVFCVAMDTVSGRLTTAIINGVTGDKAELVDGIVMSCRLDMGGAPTAYACVLERVEDLSGDPEADERRIAALMQEHPAAPEGAVPDAIRRHLLRDIGPAAGALGGDMVLMMPHLRSIARAARA